MTLPLAAVEDLVTQILVTSGASKPNAAATAAALVAAQVDGQAGHGLSRVASYAAQVRSGKINGQAQPELRFTRTASLRIDAHGGFAYPALDLAIATLTTLTRDTGVAAAGIFNSHHIGQAGRTVERLAEHGLVAMVVSNTPRAMAIHGGVQPKLGTNPLAFAAPIPGRAPLVIDLALSLVARAKIVAAQKAGKPIPPDWAIDSEGNPATDATAALGGALLPAGGAKGSALALMLEILCGALAGGHFGWQATSFLDDQGPSPGVGQMLVAFAVDAFSGPEFGSRMTELCNELAAESGVRLPGERRLAGRDRARTDGLVLDGPTHAMLMSLRST
ncbi:MAG: Ldh family oxidoreductase [Proteobacteria bacterium]|nr:Ldh family oxidoreductase [Pseudomonadota bacterium]